MSEEEEDEVVAKNLFQQYRHAVRLAGTTSRLKNKDWYREALDLDIQLHCYLDTGSGADCYLYNQSSQAYEALGHLDLEAIESEGGVESWIQQMLALPDVKAAKSLAVIFYVADDISTAGLGEDHQDPDQLLEIPDALEENLKEVLEDKTVSEETHAWRLLPYSGHASGAEFATVVAVPRKWESLAKRLRQYGDDQNFPIRTSALSAPLCAIASLPWCASACPQGVVGLFCYAKFTLLTIFNSDAELMMLRHISHAKGARLPRNIGPTVFSTATAYELENPDLYVFPLAGEEMDGVILSLQTAVKGAQIMLVDTADILQSRGVNVNIPLEILTTTQAQDPGVYPLAGNRTFSDFREHGWPYQDFYAPSRAELSSTPDAAGMKMLKLSRWLKAVAALVLIGSLSFFGMQIWQDVMSETWQYKAENHQVKTVSLTQKLKEYKKWDNLLLDRSKAWVSMELVSQMVPDDGSVILQDVKHKIKRGESGKQKKAGFEKVWEISGTCNEKGIQQFEDYNLRNGVEIAKLFKRVAQVTGNQAYLTDVKDRDLVVKFTRTSNKISVRRASPQGQVEKVLPYQFSLTIVQSFAPDDVIAIQ